MRVLGCEARGSNSYVRSSVQHALHGARDASTRMHICGPTHRIMDQRAQTAPTRQHDHMHQLKHRLSRTSKPKSRHKTNTFCPLTPTARPHAPTKIPTFPHQKAKQSPFQQHDLSILIVGPNQLKHRLSRTRKPNSHPSSNTFCPSSYLLPTN